MKNLINFEDFLLERMRRPADQVNKEAEDDLKRRTTNYMGLMKKYPKKATEYKARIDLVRAKLMVIAAKKKVDALAK